MKWKISFFALLGMILAILTFLSIRIFTIREDDSLFERTNKTGEAIFQVSLNKKQTNDIINFYLDKVQKDSEIKYSFVIEDQALLKGVFKFLGHDVNFYLYFKPYIIENGDVLLKATSLSIGTLSLPISDLMKYISKNYKIPDYVLIDPENESMTVYTNQITVPGDMYFEASEIDLINDIFKFNAYLPIEEE